uniref:Uncharacterized protein n=1 Tax=Anguilla anguilla TaxID=7936 RepID=A0A0E9RHB9_ANGAN
MRLKTLWLMWRGQMLKQLPLIRSSGILTRYWMLASD